MPEEGTEGLVKYGSERTLNNGNNWKDVVSSLPVEETIDGEKYYYFYYVKEVKAPAKAPAKKVEVKAAPKAAAKVAPKAEVKPIAKKAPAKKV